MIRAAILAAPGFQDEEFVYPYYRMLEEGWIVDVAAAGAEKVFGKYGVPARQNKTFNALVPKDYDAVIIPGGYECPDRLRMSTVVCKFVKDMFMEGKLVAAICHGPWVCISAGIVRGLSVTGYESIHDDLHNAGASVMPMMDVVKDRNLITSSHYQHNGPFMREVIRALTPARYGEVHAL